MKTPYEPNDSGQDIDEGGYNDRLWSTLAVMAVLAMAACALTVWMSQR